MKRGVQYRAVFVCTYLDQNGSKAISVAICQVFTDSCRFKSNEGEKQNHPYLVNDYLSFSIVVSGQLPEETVLEILEKYYVCFSKKFGTSIPRGRTEGCSGIEIWRIENFQPVAVPKDLHGKFFTGDSYVILKTTALKSGALRHDIHYWLGKDTSQDEAGTAAIKTVELDAVLGGRAVQYREVQGHETEKFLSYFKPCIIPQEGGIASGFKHAEAEEHQTRLYVCKGKHVIHVKEASFDVPPYTSDDS
ncbi:Villin-4 [Sesamum angolense]|uniref:Villin-4 n=1 Tax=Sesamum angolense TaxID=2727404 RepID=A0AAE1X3L4_9LAMI|nr:Villin-4 [Sesamum angolense]